jgi:hypothetical protein
MKTFNGFFLGMPAPGGFTAGKAYVYVIYHQLEH